MEGNRMKPKKLTGKPSRTGGIARAGEVFITVPFPSGPRLVGKTPSAP